MSAIYDLTRKTFLALEESITPLPKGSDTIDCIAHHIDAVWLTPCAMVMGAITLPVVLVDYAIEFFASLGRPKKLENFEEVLEDSRLWEQIDVSQTSLKEHPELLIGTATCAYQDSGAAFPNSQWAEWEKKVIKDPDLRSKGPGLFELYKTKEGRAVVIDRLQKLHLNCARFSIEWSDIEPRKGEYNEESLQIYCHLFKDLRDAGIEPIVTLHHFSEPQWFHDLGSFEKEENIAHFVAFAEKVFPSITQDYKGKPLVEKICTINEPGIEAFSRYVRGAFSPGVAFNFVRGAYFLKGAIKAHKCAYEALKKIKPEIQIGLTHQYLRFIPGNFLFKPITRYLTRFVNNTLMDCFDKKRFVFKLPFACNIQEEMPELTTDFIGVQTYVRPHIGFRATQHNEEMTMMPFREDPAAIHEAIVRCHRAFHAPVLVTENGISTKSDIQRARFMGRTLFATGKAAEKIGYENFLGYLQWSFTDNLEWDMGKTQPFGAYKLLNGQIAKQPKAGVAPFIAVAQAIEEKRREAIAAA